MSENNVHPVRIQRKRTKGFRLRDACPNDLPVVCVTRGTKWGNPFVKQAVEGNEVVVSAYENSLDPATIAAARQELRGKNLACFCRLDEVCHADVLLKLANE